MMSNRLLEEHRLKLDRYALLAAIAERQCLDGMRPVAPLILPLVATTHGEFCPGVFLLQEWLAEKFRSRLLSRDPWRTARTRTTSRRFFVGTSVRRCSWH